MNIACAASAKRLSKRPNNPKMAAANNSLDCPACGGDGCGVCGGGLLGARKQQVSLEVPIHASSSAYCGCGGLGCEMCGGGMLLAAAAPTRAAVHS